MAMMEEFLREDAIRQERARRHPVMHGLETGFQRAASMALFMLVFDALGYRMFEGKPTPRFLFVLVVGGIAILQVWLGLRFKRAAT